MELCQSVPRAWLGSCLLAAVPLTACAAERGHGPPAAIDMTAPTRDGGARSAGRPAPVEAPAPSMDTAGLDAALDAGPSTPADAAADAAPDASTSPTTT